MGKPEALEMDLIENTGELVAPEQGLAPVQKVLLDSITPPLAKRLRKRGANKDFAADRIMDLCLACKPAKNTPPPPPVSDEGGGTRNPSVSPADIPESIDGRPPIGFVEDWKAREAGIKILMGAMGWNAPARSEVDVRGRILHEHVPLGPTLQQAVQDAGRLGWSGEEGISEAVDSE
jgi:hypothetical protein